MMRWFDGIVGILGFVVAIALVLDDVHTMENLGALFGAVALGLHKLDRFCDGKRS